jgi:hypothetical protein
VADWDGDGSHDLLMGCGDGSVLFYRNTTPSGMPVLAEPVVLVPASAKYTRRGGEYPFERDLGMRSKIAVADYNSDGRDDLLMGIFGSETKEDPTLTDAEVARRDSVDARMRELSMEFSPRFEEAMRGVLAGFGVESYADLDRDQQTLYRERIRTAYEALPGYDAYQREMEHLSGIYMKYRPEFEYIGWVWVFLRK